MGAIVHILNHTGEKATDRQLCSLDSVRHVQMRGMPLSWASCGKFQCTIIITRDDLIMCNVSIIEHIKTHKVNSSIYCQYKCITESLLKYAETMGSIVHMLIHTGENAYSRQLCGLDLVCHITTRGMPLSCSFWGKFQYATIITRDYLAMCNVITIKYLRKYALNSIIYRHYECFTERLVKYVVLCESQVLSAIKLTGHTIIHTEDLRLTTLYAEYYNQNYKVEVSNAMVCTAKLDDHTKDMISDTVLSFWHAILILKCSWMLLSCTLCDINPNQITEYTTFQWIYIQMYYCTKWDKWLFDILAYLKWR